MPEAVARRRRRPAGRINLFLWLGATLLAAFAVLAVLGERVAPYDPTAQDLFAMLEGPTAAHLFGTDNVGRDILSRIIVGTRFTLSIALASMFFAGIGGIALGSIAGYFGGVTDRVVTGIIDLLLTVPNIVLAIAIAAAAGGDFVVTHVVGQPAHANATQRRVLERDQVVGHEARAVLHLLLRAMRAHQLPDGAAVGSRHGNAVHVRQVVQGVRRALARQQGGAGH